VADRPSIRTLKNIRVVSTSIVEWAMGLVELLAVIGRRSRSEAPDDAVAVRR